MIERPRNFMDKYEKNTIKKEQGITLISLTVTIIVMIILAGATISLVTGDNGMVAKAKEIKANIEKAQEEGQNRIDSLKGTTIANDGTTILNDENAPTINSMDVTYVTDTSFKVSVNVTETGSGLAKIEYSIDGGEHFTTPKYDNRAKSYTFDDISLGFEEYNVVVKATDVEGNSSTSNKKYQQVVKRLIPEGFYYVGGKTNKGVVISDSKEDENKYSGQEIVGTDLQGNQFVWIPCTIDNSGSELKYARTEWYVETDGDDNSRAIKDELTLNDSSVTYSDKDKEYGINAGITNEIVAQINAEKASVAKYGGYYIGRYEVGKSGDTTVVKYNQTPYGNITWSTAYNLAKGVIKNQEATSYLCSSYAWDTAVNFIQNNSTAKDYATSIEGFNGNWYSQVVKDKSGNIIKSANTSQQLNTGLTTQFCNIFDIGGNESEFTTELNPGTSETVVFRSGDYAGTLQAGSRWDAGSDCCDTDHGFRTTLFLTNTSVKMPIISSVQYASSGFDSTQAVIGDKVTLTINSNYVLTKKPTITINGTVVNTVWNGKVGTATYTIPDNITLTEGEKIPVSVSDYAADGRDGEAIIVSNYTSNVYYSKKNVQEGKYAIITALNDGYRIDIDDGKQNENSGNAQLWNNGCKQLFELIYIGDGYYKIKCTPTDFVLDVNGGSSESGTNLQQYTWNDTNSQKWKFNKTTDGNYYFIQSKIGTVLDLSNGTIADGTNILLWTLDSSKKNQQWKLEKN